MERDLRRALPSVFAFVRYRLRGSDEAEDLAAQVFEVAYARATHFDYRGIPIEGWLIGIARNLVRDHLRKIGRRGYEEELLDTTAPTTVDNAVGVDLHEDLRLAMKDLTADQQAVLSLRFFLDKSVADTARLMNRSEDAVKNLQRRALAAMQRSLNARTARHERQTSRSASRNRARDQRCPARRFGVRASGPGGTLGGRGIGPIRRGASRG